MKMSTIDWIIANILRKQLKCKEKQKQHFQISGLFDRCRCTIQTTCLLGPTCLFQKMNAPNSLHVIIIVFFFFIHFLAFSVQKYNSIGPKCRFPHLCFTRFLLFFYYMYISSLFGLELFIEFLGICISVNVHWTLK